MNQCIIQAPNPVTITCNIEFPEHVLECNIESGRLSKCTIQSPRSTELECDIEPARFSTCIIQSPKSTGLKCHVKLGRFFTCIIQYPTPIELKCDIKLSERAILVNTSAVIYKMMYVWGAYKDVHQVWRGIPICNLPAIAGVHGTALKNNVITKTKKNGKTFYLVDKEKLRSFRSKFLTSILNTDLTQIQETAKMFDLIPGITRFPSYLHLHPFPTSRDCCF